MYTTGPINYVWSPVIDHHLSEGGYGCQPNTRDTAPRYRGLYNRALAQLRQKMVEIDLNGSTNPNSNPNPERLVFFSQGRCTEDFGHELSIDHLVESWPRAVYRRPWTEKRQLTHERKEKRHSMHTRMNRDVLNSIPVHP